MELIMLIVWMIGFPISQRICEQFDRKMGWNPTLEELVRLRRKELIIYFFLAGSFFIGWLMRLVHSILTA